MVYLASAFPLYLATESSCAIVGYLFDYSGSSIRCVEALMEGPSLSLTLTGEKVELLDRVDRST